MGGIQSAGRSVQWFAENFFKEVADQTEDRYRKMNDETEVVSVGSDGVLFVPHLRGSIVPHQMPFARGSFLGLREIHGRGHMARAIYEGLSMEYRIILDRLEELLNTTFPDMRCFGGGSQNPSWIRIKAHVLNRPVIVYETKENTCLGAAILAGVGCGLYRDLEDAFQQIQHKTTIIEPDPEKAARYETLYQDVYRPMFQHLRNINRMIENHLNEEMNR
jgi:xylulokinase